MQRVFFPQFSRAMITLQTDQESPILVTPKTPTGKRMNCSVALGTQNDKRNVLYSTIAARFTREKIYNFKRPVCCNGGRNTNNDDGHVTNDRGNVGVMEIAEAKINLANKSITFSSTMVPAMETLTGSTNAHCPEAASRRSSSIRATL